jgi:hypothetical protein
VELRLSWHEIGYVRGLLLNYVKKTRVTR